MAETNRYAQQQLSQFPQRLAKFEPVTPADLKALMGINIIIGMVKLPSLKLYWSSDDASANKAIKEPRNRFFQINNFLHFNNADWEPPHVGKKDLIVCTR